MFYWRLRGRDFPKPILLFHWRFRRPKFWTPHEFTCLQFENRMRDYNARAEAILAKQIWDDLAAE
jgi:hypothetical protein